MHSVSTPEMKRELEKPLIKSGHYASHLIVALPSSLQSNLFSEQLNGVPKCKRNTENFGYRLYNICNVLHPEL